MIFETCQIDLKSDLCLYYTRVGYPANIGIQIVLKFFMYQNYA